MRGYTVPLVVAVLLAVPPCWRLDGVLFAEAAPAPDIALHAPSGEAATQTAEAPPPDTPRPDLGHPRP